MLTRRAALVLLPALCGCTALLPPVVADGTGGPARAILAESAAAHGLAALQRVSDLSVGYSGMWHGLVGQIQPALVDAGFRGASQERLLLRDGVVAQAYGGPAGHKQVLRRWMPGGQGEVRVWFNGEEAHDPERRAAAALVADGYSLFLLGPMLLAGAWAAERQFAVAMGQNGEVWQEGAAWQCDVVRVSLVPGLGFSAGDEVALWIDRRERLMRRVRFTLNGLVSTRGAVADVDTFGHLDMGGVRWPTRFHEGLLRPFPLPVHDWRLTGLDVNRGMTVADVAEGRFTGGAAPQAGMLQP